MAITYEGATEQTRQIIHHHAVLRRGLERRVGTLCEAVQSGVPFERPMTMLRDYLVGEIFPHAEAEERTLYQAAATQARGGELVRELTREHHTLAYLAGRLRAGTDGGEVAAASEWITTLFRGARGQGERPAAPGAHDLRRGPGLPARGHAPVACRRARVSGAAIMNPNSALSAGQLAVMAVAVTASLATWLIAVFPAATRYIRGRRRTARGETRGENCRDRDQASLRHQAAG
jgi:hypothetical protein